MLNTTILGRYEIKTQVRENDLLIEYTGRDVRTDKDVTAIVILAQAIPAVEFLSRFESISKIESEDMPALIELGQVNGQAVVIHEFAEGKSLADAAEFIRELEEMRSAVTVAASSHPLSMEDSLVGQTLGAYRLVSRLGQGGMATVYKAYEPALDRYVAVKILPQFFASDPVFVQRFKREAKAIAQLNHPNIVPIYSYGESNRITYIAMQYVIGDTLKHDGQDFTFEKALRLLIPVARALGYAHQRGIVHRDIKPSNILISEEGWPLLADFGLAQMTQVSAKLTESGVGMGTPMYMSPEQGQGEKLDHRTDIYSLGIVLYELITGDVPFRADTPMAIVIKHISAPMPMPHIVNPNVPEYLEAIILKATAKNPDDRYQTAEEMAAAMEDAIPRLSSAAPISTPARATLFSGTKKNPAPAKSQTEVKVEAARPSALQKMMRALTILIAIIICLPLVGVLLMGIFDICPPQGPWSQPPWCEGSPYQLPTFDENNESGQATPAPTHAPPAFVLDDFDGNFVEGRSDWGVYVDDNQTVANCFVSDSRELRESNYLQYDFDVVENSWSTCGFYFDNIQNLQDAHGIAFDIRADQANMPYGIMLLGGAPDQVTSYLYELKTPPQSVNEWTRVEIPWSEMLGVEWEENGGKSFDPAMVTGLLVSVASGQARQRGTLWVDDVRLLEAPAQSIPNSARLFSDDFENPAWTKLDSYSEENTDTKVLCAVDSTFARESASSLKFEFDVAPAAWASCGFAFDTERDWRIGKGVGFYIRAEEAGLPYEVSVITSSSAADENYVYEMLTEAESVNGWTWVEIPWENFLRVEWEENAGAPLMPRHVIGLWLGAGDDAQYSGAFWVDDVQVIP